jgi:DNA-binding transcriptional ArsR family regulator
MKEGPNIASLAALIGDPARANMLTALFSGQALTATELSLEAGITPQTASSHLKKLEDGGLVKQRKQGRHKYFELFDEQVAHLLETLLGVAENKGLQRVRTGPRDTALRHARVCYNHLAGNMGVQMYDSLLKQDLIHLDGDQIFLNDAGKDYLKNKISLDIDQVMSRKKMSGKLCLDWSVRRSHLAGPLGIALLDHFKEKHWARRAENSRIVTFTPKGTSVFNDCFSNPD